MNLKILFIANITRTEFCSDSERQVSQAGMFSRYFNAHGRSCRFEWLENRWTSRLWICLNSNWTAAFLLEKLIFCRINNFLLIFRRLFWNFHMKINKSKINRHGHNNGHERFVSGSRDSTWIRLIQSARKSRARLWTDRCWIDSRTCFDVLSFKIKS